jgi:hypothetical protein
MSISIFKNTRPKHVLSSRNSLGKRNVMRWSTLRGVRAGFDTFSMKIVGCLDLVRCLTGETIQDSFDVTLFHDGVVRAQCFLLNRNAVLVFLGKIVLAHATP